MAQSTKEEIFNAVKYVVSSQVGARFGTYLTDKNGLDLTNDSDYLLILIGDPETGDLVVQDTYPGREIARFKIVPA